MQEMSCHGYRANRPAVASVILTVAAGLAVGGCTGERQHHGCAGLPAQRPGCGRGGRRRRPLREPRARAGKAGGSANPAVAAGWALPGGNLAEHAGCRQRDQQLERLQAGRGVDVPLRSHRRTHTDGCLRDHPGSGERRGVRPGPGVERDGDQPRHRQGPVAARLQLAQRRPGRRHRGRRSCVRGDESRRGRPVGGHRRAVVEPDADRQRPRGHRHGARLRPRHRVRVHRAGQRDGSVPARRRGDLVGAERQDRRAGVVLEPGAGPVGQPGRQLRRRAVVHAVVRRPGQHLPGHRQPRPAVRHQGLPVGEQPARPGPVHRLGGEAEPGREAAVVLPAHPARPVRLGPAGLRRCSAPSTGSRW